MTRTNATSRERKFANVALPQHDGRHITGGDRLGNRSFEAGVAGLPPNDGLEK
jgi:hypothetical protein